MYFSIAIPTYEMHGKGVEFLNHSFQKLHQQTFSDFEIIISDHSSNNDIENLCISWQDRLDIKYYKNEINRGNSSSNLNNAISKCSGEWIKILFQDDYIFEENSLKYHHIFINQYATEEWLVTACERSRDGIEVFYPFYPRWNDEMVYGVNTISSPSVVCFKNKFESNLKFDERLVWLMDVEFYKKMYDAYGEPQYMYNITVVNRIWEKQFSNVITGETRNKEHEIIENDYPR